MNTLF